MSFSSFLRNRVSTCLRVSSHSPTTTPLAQLWKRRRHRPLYIKTRSAMKSSIIVSTIAFLVVGMCAGEHESREGWSRVGRSRGSTRTRARTTTTSSTVSANRGVFAHGKNRERRTQPSDVRGQEFHSTREEEEEEEEKGREHEVAARRRRDDRSEPQRRSEVVLTQVGARSTSRTTTTTPAPIVYRAKRLAPRLPREAKKKKDVESAPADQSAGEGITASEDEAVSRQR